MNEEQPVYADVMLDIETLSTGLKAQVVSIGAVLFRLDTTDDLDTIRDPERSFYAVLDTDDQATHGRVTDPDTLDWWTQQSDQAREVLDAECEDNRVVLERLVDFCRGVRRVWGNGNTFDNAIVRDLCGDYDVSYPVEYYGDLDMRTLKYLWNKLTNWGSNVKSLRLGEHHNALDDARSQVLQCQTMYRELKGSKYNGIKSAG